MQRACRALLYCVPAVATAIALAPTADAAPVNAKLLPPVAKFAAMNGGGARAEITNPNHRGVCWAANADTGAVFKNGPSYETMGPDQYLIKPGQLHFVYVKGLPNGPAHLVGRCANNFPPATHDVTSSSTAVSTIQVTGAGIPLTGSSGG